MASCAGCALRQIRRRIDGGFAARADDRPAAARLPALSVMPRPSRPASRYRVGSRRRADERQLVGRWRRGSRSRRGWPRGGELRHVLIGAARACGQHGGSIGGCVVLLILPRRADEQLAGPARLDVEGDGVGGGGVGALQIAELDQLMAHEAGIAVGDDEVALSFLAGAARE